MKTLIIEDEPQAISALKQELQLNCPEVVLLDVAQNVRDGVKKIKQHQPDLIFLDIQLSDGLGFDILKKLKKINFKVIITTAYSNYALKAIKFSALDYLLKPIDTEELKKAVDKAAEQNQGDLSKKIDSFLQNQNNLITDKRIVFQTSEGVFLHHISNIIRCNSEGNYTHIHFETGKKLLVTKTLKDLDELLSSHGFERIHHSHLINLRHLISYISKDGGYVVMSNKTTLPVSQRKKVDFIKKLEMFNK